MKALCTLLLLILCCPSWAATYNETLSWSIPSKDTTPASEVVYTRANGDPWVKVTPTQRLASYQVARCVDGPTVSCSQATVSTSYPTGFSSWSSLIWCEGKAEDWGGSIIVREQIPYASWPTSWPTHLTCSISYGGDTWNYTIPIGDELPNNDHDTMPADEYREASSTTGITMDLSPALSGERLTVTLPTKSYVSGTVDVLDASGNPVDGATCEVYDYPSTADKDWMVLAVERDSSNQIPECLSGCYCRVHWGLLGVPYTDYPIVIDRIP